MYCRNCGNQLTEGSVFCGHCGAVSNTEQVIFVQRVKPQFYTAGFVLGILSICLAHVGVILGVIGLPLACISKRKSAIILNIIGLVWGISIWVFLIWIIPTIEPYEWPQATSLIQYLGTLSARLS